MKNKLFKKIGLLSISTLAVISFVTQAKAAEENKKCQEVTYTNYYFFSEIYTKTELNTIITDGNQRYHGTFFPALPENTITDSIQGIKVCLTSDDSDALCIKNDFNLDRFYTKYKDILNSANNPKTVTFEIDDDNLTKKEGSSTYITEGTTSYYLHGTWYETDETGNITGDSKEVKRYNEIENDELKKGVIIPDTTTITPIIAKDKEEPIKFLITRKITTTDIDGKTGFKLPSYSSEENTYLTPALYRITYNVEECTDKYTATINYFIRNSDGTVTEINEKNKLKFDDGSTSPWNKTNLDDGYTEKVTSPKLEGCKADKSAVDVKIEGADFKDEVYYTCEIKENGKTGSALIFTAWTIGIGALGYSVYHFSKMKKETEI